jgi:hypothetical protein
MPMFVKHFEIEDIVYIMKDTNDRKVNLKYKVSDN